MRECFVCGRWAETERHHLIGGTANRRLSEKYGLVAYLCWDCHRKAHTDHTLYLELHKYAELKWLDEQNAEVEDFIKVFGKNYLRGERHG